VLSAFWYVLAAGARLYSASLDSTHIFDPRNVSADYMTFPNTGSAGGTWTITRAATGEATAVVDRPLLLFGGGQTMAAQGIPQSTDHTILIAKRTFWTVGQGMSYGAMFYSTPSVAGSREPGLYRDDTQDKIFAHAFGGEDCYGVPHSKASVVGVRFAQGKFRTISDGVPAGVEIATARPTSPYALQFSQTEEEFVAAAIWDRALTDQEIATVSQELAGVPHDKQTDPHKVYPPLVAGTTAAALPVGAREGTIAVLADNTIAVRTRTGGWKQLTVTTLPGSPP
jgi:hypothetical protein